MGWSRAKLTLRLMSVRRSKESPYATQFLHSTKRARSMNSARLVELLVATALSRGQEAKIRG